MKWFRMLLIEFKKGIIVLSFFLLFPIARISISRKNIWIITERPDEARDNGFEFFSYLIKNHPDVNVFYAIHKNSPDYQNLSFSKRIIDFGSFRHRFYFCGSKFVIGTIVQFFYPSYYLAVWSKKHKFPVKTVYLGHGITKDNMVENYKKNAKINLYLCGGYKEYLAIKRDYGYNENEIKYTGYARFDSYFNLRLKRQILIMPTWRRWLSFEKFDESGFYLNWISLLNDSRFSIFLEKNDITAYLFLHPLFQNYRDIFKLSSKRIIVCDWKQHNLRTLIKESSALITDYSSVFFDFGYMQKMIVYYQFDESQFFKGHYSKGYFDYRLHGFGPVYEKKDDLIYYLSQHCDLERLSGKYLDNVIDFFKNMDNHNCERIYEEIMNSIK